MRLRNIPGSREIIASSDYVIHEDVMRDKKGCWADVFGNDAPLFLEIGMGKGRFISELAQREPGHNFVGIEKYSSVLLRAIQRREALEQKMHLQNLVYLRMEAEDLTDVFGPGEVAGIYLNFSDPWPKDRHAHRRLPSRARSCARMAWSASRPIMMICFRSRWMKRWKLDGKSSRRPGIFTAIPFCARET